MKESTIANLVIIGSGPAGLTAGIYAARANLNPFIVEGKDAGGQLMGTSYVENWPGTKSILGPQLMIAMREHAKGLGCTIVPGWVTSVDFSKQPFVLNLPNDKQLRARSVIIATGATAKRLGCPGEDTHWGKGVTTCAVCDGTFFKDKPVVIVGGGDTAMEDASFMTNFTDQITVVHILDKLTASAAMQERVVNNPKIKIIYNSTVTEIQGDGKQVTGAIITNQKTSEKQQLSINAVFVAIGLNPNTELFKGQLELEKNGYLKLKNNTHTSVAGVFGAGDVSDYRYRQAITSAGAGCMAALDAEKYIKEHAQ
jgi:thioredoxin reductase (NADPH)